MKNRYRVEAHLGFGTGAPEHKYGGGSGVAFSNSVKKARWNALHRARVSAGAASAWVPIYIEITFTDRVTGKTWISDREFAC